MKTFQKKNILFVLSVFVFSVLFFVFKKSVIDKNTFTVGILQTASHPALDNVRDGFIEKIKDTKNLVSKYIKPKAVQTKTEEGVHVHLDGEGDD